MTNLRQHISIFLLGIFIFPLLFQTAHRMQHHKPDCGSCCEISEQVIIQDWSAFNKAVLSEDAHCSICEYDFYIKSYTPIFTTDYNCIETYYSFTEPAFLPYKQQKLSENTPRAPPSEIS